VFLLLRGSGALRKRPVELVPDLVVEVLSGNRSHDRLTKRLLYAEAGVPEYWIVDPVGRHVEVVAGLETRETARKRLSSRVAEGLVIDVAALFRDLP
jgi:Uma2 family endonuclease